jgi:molybdenum cofactor synthesis domain-containing protein
MHKAGILIIKLKGSDREMADACSDIISKALHSVKATIARNEDVQAREAVVANTLALWADSGEVDFIITSGGTGIGPEDVTPEATRSVIDKEIPGLSEIMRLDGYKQHHSAILSRALVGIRGKCLIINLPGNPGAVQEYLELLLPIIPHAVDAILVDQ